MRKINFHLLVLSLICLTAYFFAAKTILTNRNIRLNGTRISAQVVELRHAKTHRTASVEVNGRKMDAGAIDNSYKKGDIITVYYLQGVNSVVQEHVNPKRYYWYLGFASILLFVGVAFFIESLKGKDIWSYLTSSE